MSQHVKTHISHISAEHHGWLRGLEFYNDELRIMRSRLEEVSWKNTDSDVKKQVEHFQNQFMVQEGTMNNLKHAINQHVKHMENDVIDHAQHLTLETIAEHDAARDKFMTQEKIFNDLRHEFNRFLIKTM